MARWTRVRRWAVVVATFPLWLGSGAWATEADRLGLTGVDVADGADVEEGDASEQALPAWAPTLWAEISPPAARLGEPITVTLTVERAPGVSVNLPLTLDVGPFTELSREELPAAQPAPTVDASSGKQRMVQTFRLRVAAYRLGELTFPPIALSVVGPGGRLLTLQTKAIPLRILSVLANEPNPELHELRPPVTVTVRRLWPLYLLLGALAAALIAALTVLLYRRLQAARAAKNPAPPPLPPDRVALARLGELPVDALIAAGDYKALYLSLSEIIRAYAAGRFGFDALEMTTSEIARALAASSAAPDAAEGLVRYLQACDLVKFAKYQPEEEDARQAVGEAVRLVQQTRAACSAVAGDGSTAALREGQGVGRVE